MFGLRTSRPSPKSNFKTSPAGFRSGGAFLFCAKRNARYRRQTETERFKISHYLTNRNPGAKPEPENGKMKENLSVLIVEDSEVDARRATIAIESLASELGVNVDCVVVGLVAEVPDLIDGADLVFHDLNLPDSTPAQTVESIELYRKKWHTPVVILSGQCSERDAYELCLSGATAAIPKSGVATQYKVGLAGAIGLALYRKRDRQKKQEAVEGIRSILERPSCERPVNVDKHSDNGHGGVGWIGRLVNAAVFAFFGLGSSR